MSKQRIHVRRASINVSKEGWQFHYIALSTALIAGETGSPGGNTHQGIGYTLPVRILQTGYGFVDDHRQRQWGMARYRATSIFWQRGGGQLPPPMRAQTKSG